MSAVDAGRAPGATGPTPWRTLAGIFLSVWLVYAIFLNPYPASLASNLLDLAVSWVDRGSVELHLYHEADVSIRDGRYYSGLPPGGSIPAALVYAGLRTVIPPFREPADLITLGILATLLVSAPASALCAVLVYALLRRLPLPEPARLGTTALFAFGTMNFGYATIYAKEPFVALILLGVFAFGSEPDAAQRLTPVRAVGVGLLLAYAIATVYAAVVQIAILLVYLATRLRMRQLAPIALALAGGLVPLLAYHQVAYGSPFANSYTYRGFETPRYLWAPDYERFLAIMFSPRDGLLVYSPIVALAAVGAYRAVRARLWRPEIACIAGIVLATWFFYACYRVPLPYWVPLPSEAHLATRYLHVTMPFAMLAVGLALPAVSPRLVRILGALSVFFAYLAAQAGQSSQFEIPIRYALKVWVSTFGMGMLFGQYLPERLGVETFHTVVRRPDVGLGDLWAGSWWTLARLVATQLGLFVFFLAVFALAGALLWRLWRPVLRPAAPIVSCAGSAAS